MTTEADLLAAYDAQVRTHISEPLPAGVEVDRDGPLLRLHDPTTRGYVLYRDLGGVAGDALDALIQRQIEWFGERGARFEWKLHGHDLPPDLDRHLLDAGFAPEERETVVVARVADVAGPAELPEGVTLRAVTERRDLDRLAELEEAVWDEPSRVADMLEAELAADPEALAVVVAEAGPDVVCAAWIRYEGTTEFATLWGGATLAAWRRRGIYRATVAHRASLARERGFRFLSVDASDDSRPILQRLGFVAVTTTTPYVWSPA